MTDANIVSHTSLDEGASMKSSRSSKRLLPAALAAGLLGLMAAPAQAWDFSSGEWSGNIFTTVSYGASWRLKDLEPNDVGKQSIVNDPLVFAYDKDIQRTIPGRWSANGDDGTLNYPSSGDLISHTIKATVEAQVDWRNFGAFTRFSAFYDFENADKDFLSDVAEERVGKDIRLLDLYVYGNHQPGGKFLSWRLGQQVVSWGESTFIQGGINVINPVDVSKLRVAGAELKEAFEGINMIWGSMDLTDAVALEALYMFEHQEIIPDPAGTFFSTNDIGTPGASYAMLGFVFPQPVINPDLYGTVCLEGNFGASDSPLPPDLVAVGCGTSLRRSETDYPSDSGQYGVALRWFLENLGSTELGFYFLNYHSRLPLVSGSTVFSVPPPFLNSYWTEYPEDIHLYGVSFNTTIGTWALSGEVSYRPNAPLQFDDVEVLFAGLTPTNFLQPSYYFQFKSQLGEFGPDEYIRGWDEHKQWQVQSTTTKLFGPGNIFRANQIAFVAEAGFNYVSDLPGQEYQRYEGPGTDTGGGPDWTTGDWNNPETQVGGFADDFSWGYRLVTRFDYNNAIGAWTVSPRLGWSHDVSGTTPGPGGSFVDGRKQLTVGLAFNLLNEWVFDVAYTRYMGAGEFNLFKNRDFFAASVRYSF
jgi:hypothetical protein